MDRSSRRLLTVLTEAAVTLAVVWLTDPNRPALRPMFWHRTMRGAERVARWADRAGMAAQRRYRDSLEW